VNTSVEQPDGPPSSSQIVLQLPRSTVAAAMRFVRQCKSTFRGRLLAMYVFLGLLNVGAWCAAYAAFRRSPTLLGVALLVYGLGLRHAIDADHIAAIDNVTRKLLQENKRPVSVGFFFAIGHSTIVFLLTAGVAFATTMLSRVQRFHQFGGTISTIVSAVFLLVIASMNLVIFVSIYKGYRHVRSTGVYMEYDLDAVLARQGVLSRIFRPLFRLVNRSWHMLFLGLLFGLGFDTATEIAVFTVSATQASNGVSIAAVLTLPLLFAAGMSLLDSTDGVMMLGAYEWARDQPARRLYYNMTVTLVSVLVAALIGGLEAFSLLSGPMGFPGAGRKLVAVFERNLTRSGLFVLAAFAVAWLVSYILNRTPRSAEPQISASPQGGIV
jgi:nickel/cobalt transporter (NiCoT) family protein